MSCRLALDIILLQSTRTFMQVISSVCQHLSSSSVLSLQDLISCNLIAVTICRSSPLASVMTDFTNICSIDVTSSSNNNTINNLFLCSSSQPLATTSSVFSFGSHFFVKREAHYAKSFYTWSFYPVILYNHSRVSWPSFLPLYLLS